MLVVRWRGEQVLEAAGQLGEPAVDRGGHPLGARRPSAPISTSQLPFCWSFSENE